ncbi:tetratricopeptide repeat protein [Spirulina major CS-329]|uniref:tetratricopeptide repeat protein n=1 Tax=Spirulina TaxID=1154 RepID=UPI00232E45E3|nr:MULTISPECIES: tetratricopeptide repeat protein [Spirulina]MDB9495258.1 tetratricopeptide repeat protein [Spirulina subsalsa CS-330]MDB9501726.1 tetratricopeptide repeat protein [Spirulina major CS-329]
MLDEIAEAIQQEDYRRAAQLLKPLLKTDRKNPWVRFYVGRVQEGMGQRDEAERLYLQLLPQTTNPKLIRYIRQGIARIEAIAARSRQDAIAAALATPGGDDLGVFILEPMPAEHKKAAAKVFSTVMKLDLYSARLQLPSRGWRFYRTGPLGELNYYATTLNAAQVPCFAIALSAINDLNVFTVKYFGPGDNGPTVRCINSAGQPGTLTFQWSEVTQRVIGRIPLFESVVSFDAKNQLIRKTQTQDYLWFCDLHLPQRNCILRLSEHHYQFLNGITLTPTPGNAGETVSQNWELLMDFLTHQLPSGVLWSDFATFADSAIDFRETLNRLPSRIDLERRRPSLWDQAFQLYSGLAYWRDGWRREHANALPAVRSS